MTSPARQMRRRAERARRRTPGPTDRSRRLFHGTTAALADAIRLEGLCPGRDGRVYLADSLAMAQTYAMWATAMASTVAARPNAWRPRSDIGRKALELGGQVAVVAHVRLAAGVPVHPEHGSVAPPLPWQTVIAPGDAFYVERPLQADCVRPFELWRVGELDEPGMIDRVRHDSDLIAATFRRDHRTPGSRAPKSSSGLLDAVPNPAALIVAALKASTNADSPWHGASHWLGVAAAGIRLLEAGATADPAVLLAFAVLHDSQRQCEGSDPDHGARAAQLAHRLTGERHSFTVEQLETLTAALVDHDRGQVTDDPTIGACWDADRLTLPRVGITPNPAMLSTPAGRELADDLDRIPDPRDCDWPWALFRFQVLTGAGDAMKAAA